MGIFTRSASLVSRRRKAAKNRNRRLHLECFEERRVLAAIVGSVFIDSNANQFRDPGEESQSGVTVFIDANDDGVLDASSEVSTISDADGNYAFSDVSGEVIIRQVVRDDFQQTSPLTVEESRLFGADPSSDTIVEFNPATGEELSRFPAPVAFAGATGLAFDGDSLWLINGSGDDVLYQIDPDDGEVIDADLITAGSGRYDGLAALDGSVFVLDFGADQILEFDPLSDTITNQVSVPGVGRGLAGITGPNELVANVNGEISLLNPETGFINSQLFGSTGFGLTVVEGEILTNSNGGPVVDRFSRDGTFLGSFSLTSLNATGGSVGVVALGGSDMRFDDALRFTAEPSEEIFGADFGNLSLLGDVQGTVFEDVNGNQVQDPDEGGLEGVTLYVDANGNAVFDATTEISTVSDADGNYTLSGLSGEVEIRQVVPEDFQQTSPLAVGASRLFAADPVTETIAELDPETGEELNRFLAPVIFGGQAGLAFDGDSLWFINGFTDDILYQLDPDTGAVIDSDLITDGGGAYSAIAALGDSIFVLDDAADLILEFDPQSDTVINQVSVPGIGRSLAGITGPDELVASINNELAFVDPQTGAINSQLPVVAGLGIAVVNGDILTNVTAGNSTINRYSRDGELLGEFVLANPATGLGGDDVVQFTNSFTVTAIPSGVVTGADFGNQRLNTTPVADPGGPYVVAEGGVSVLDASGSFDSEQASDTLTYDCLLYTSPSPRD